ncbi:acetate kinase [Robiginitalea myxolifaciens]|uniref:Acetate kinase n=1 Tax=Robiginitalea myxolifaciens TaxID=400055 RepID=A0A1I6FMZ4_9FLAO|nr:acetate kinase [Robiginitalea myxolifaciens]SFR31322.1 acetate kinase [Robiginitalea myxolifaciens]
MIILVLNSGSSSLKFQVIQMPEEQVLSKGLVERIGEAKGAIHYQNPTDSIVRDAVFRDHEEGLKAVIQLLTDSELGCIKNLEEIQAVGHRVVHGGDSYDAPTRVDAHVREAIEQLASLAPLHNPANLAGIEICEQLMPAAAQVAVFDTAFHQTMPEKAYRYSIPRKISEANNIRAYGFHGTSHKYVSEKAQTALGQSDSKIISIHLGNGCSMTALRNGKSVDHSLGFGPSNGLIMGTRSGDIDQSVIFYLMESLGMSGQEINSLLQKESGLLGLTGYSDLRDVQREAEAGNRDCQVALEMIVYRIRKYIGAYAAALNGLDALVFTAGIGENSSYIREQVCLEMDYLGIALDTQKNTGLDKSQPVSEIQAESSRVKIFVIPTNEELEIAKQTFGLLA